jgi:hypothetical protein
MNKDIHLAALRAAGKVAFSMAFLAGCGSSNQSEAQSTDDLALKGKQPKDAAATNEASTAVTNDAGPASCGNAKFTCEDLVKAAFPTPGDYPGTKVTVSAQVASCCHDLLTENRWDFENRWDCCANHGDDALNNDLTTPIGTACTPWGPPVPPAMKRRARGSDTIGVA